MTQIALFLVCLGGCLVGLAACKQDEVGLDAEEGPALADQIAQTCVSDPRAYDWFIGRELAQVRHFFPVGDRKFGLREPGGIYTQEFVFGRTLVYVDAAARIRRVSCG